MDAIIVPSEWTLRGLQGLVQDEGGGGICWVWSGRCSAFPMKSEELQKRGGRSIDAGRSKLGRPLKST